MEDNKKKVTFETAKSVHIFAYPFIGLEEKLSEKFENKGWLKKEITEENEKQAYMLRQYLSTQARNIYIDNSICKIYMYPLEEDQNPTYKIGTKEKEYNLPIKEIELHVYNDEVGILFIKVLNNNDKTTIDDILQINNKGRDIELPFIPDGEEGYIACAEQIGVVYGNDSTSYMTDYRQMVKDYHDEDKKAGAKEKMEHAALFLQEIFNVRLGNTDKKETTEDISIKPTVDDRMYVMAIVRDNALSEMIKKSEWTDEEEKKLYKLIFIDDNGIASCQEKIMRKEMLKRNIYPRWRDFGTVHAITDYSFVCLTSTNEEINASVIRPMYAEYLYACSLVMAQKLLIMKYSEKAGELAATMNKMPRINYINFINLRKEYVVFLNQLMLTEFSCQQQGVELYDMMKELMLVNKERELFEAQLEGLYEIANTVNGNKTSMMANLLAILGAILALLQIGLFFV